MFAKNVGGIDRVLRIVIGLALILGFFLNMDGAYSWLYLIGVPIALTGIFSTCLAYRIIGMNTCPTEKR
ncbi:YgaP family membrane protein [Roseicitreum antarcticum]|uniref:Inner membrane protein YgaP-like transmembrane domain-containing protein n=1 Tax=Roseicitreum antarcticum TaxID=564137 RepID=A0A1H3BUQ5_9RHOB|nr:DUF2892 domain-containing protein [Roseicitreum antarcticum]SDX45633.1 Protein of unknown function [Roseicitreum antarcticum]